MSRIDRREFFKKGAAIISLPTLTFAKERNNRYPTISKAVRARINPADNPFLFNLVLVTDSHVRLKREDPQNLYPSDKFANDKNQQNDFCSEACHYTLNGAKDKDAM